MTVFHPKLGHGPTEEGEGDLRELRGIIADALFPKSEVRAMEEDYFGENTVTETIENELFKAEFGRYLLVKMDYDISKCSKRKELQRMRCSGGRSTRLSFHGLRTLLGASLAPMRRLPRQSACSPPRDSW